MSWIGFALLSCLSNTGRDLFIKKKFKESSHLIVAATRAVAFILLLLLFPLFYRDFRIELHNLKYFILVVLITAVLTVIATVLKITVIQKEEISRSSPLFGLTPIFILPWTYLLLGERPTAITFIGLLMAVSGTYIVINDKNKIKDSLLNKNTLYILITLVIYGLTTTLDKIAIGYSSAYTYTLIWTGVSAISSIYVIRLVGFKKVCTFSASGKNLFQAMLWTIGFISQQMAIQFSYNIAANTAYVKSISYIGIIISVFAGKRMFKEKRIISKLLGSIIIIAGNIIILLFA